MLGENHVIVLAGHLHRFGMVVRETTHGRFLLLTASSVLESLNQKPSEILTGLKEYGKSMLDLEAGFSPGDREERLKMLREEKPKIRYFESADLQGYIVLHINDRDVTADLYSGTGLHKWKSVNLSQTLKIGTLHRNRHMDNTFK